jgi:hypothetical protein
LASEVFFGLDKIGAWVTISNPDERVLCGYRLNFQDSLLSKVFAWMIKKSKKAQCRRFDRFYMGGFIMRLYFDAVLCAAAYIFNVRSIQRSLLCSKSMRI